MQLGFQCWTYYITETLYTIFIISEWTVLLFINIILSNLIILLFLFSKYSGIILYALRFLLFQKLFQHNVLLPINRYTLWACVIFTARTIERQASHQPHCITVLRYHVDRDRTRFIYSFTSMHSEFHSSYRACHIHHAARSP